MLPQMIVRVPAGRLLPYNIRRHLTQFAELVGLSYKQVMVRPGVETYGAVALEFTSQTLSDAVSALDVLKHIASSFDETITINPSVRIDSLRLLVEVSRPVIGARRLKIALRDMRLTLLLLRKSKTINFLDRILLTPDGARWDAITYINDEPAYLVSVQDRRIVLAPGVQHLPAPLHVPLRQPRSNNE